MGKDKSKDAGEQKPAKVRLDGNYPSLNNVSWLVGYLEQFLTILSEPLLIMCAVIAFVDFQTRGALLNNPFIMYLWAISLGIAIDASMIMTGRRAVKAFTLNYYGRGIILMLITILLGVISWAALDVQSLQQALKYTSEQAFAEIYLSPALIIDIRSGVAIAMMVVVAVSNHTAVTTAQAPARRIEFLSKVVDKIAPKIEHSAQPEAPAQIASAQPPAQAPAQKPATFAPPAQPVSKAPAIIEQDTGEHEQIKPAQLHAVQTPLERVRQAMIDNPGVSDRKLAELAGLGSGNTAKKYRLEIESERQAAVV